MKIRKSGFGEFCMALSVLSLGMALLGSGAAQAAPQYNENCDFCHHMPPIDSPDGERDPDTGGVKGNHQAHAGTTAATCVKCHGSAVAVYPTGHRTKTIQVQGNINNSPAGAAYSRSFFNQTSVPPAPLGSCSNVNCHFEGTTPPWGSAVFAAPADCSRCHAVAPATGNHPVSGSKHGSYYGTGTGSCLKCHPDHLSQGAPFSHATSAANRGIVVQFASLPNSGGVYSGNGLGFLPSQQKVSFGNCSALYCHSDGAGHAPNQTPAWGAALDCKGCHNSNAASTLPMTSGKHGAHVNNAGVLGTNFGCAECHAKTVASDTAISSLGNHVNGFVDFSGARAGKNYNSATGVCSSVYCHSDGRGNYRDLTASSWKSPVTLDCRGCHGAAASPAFASLAGEPNYASAGAGQPGANTHQSHVRGAADCAHCHAATVDGSGKLSGAGHLDGSVQVAFAQGVAGAAATWNQGAGSCSSILCHSDGTSLATGAGAGGSAVWGSPPLGCSGCHGYPPAYANGAPKANSHANHGFGCNVCHAGTTTDGSTISSSLHANRAYDVSPGPGTSFGYSYAATGGTCSNISCHANTSATWGSTLACTTCHGYPPPNAAVGYAGLDETTSPHLKHAGTGSNYSFACNECHKGNTHGNGSFQDVFLDKSGIKAGPAASYDGSTKTCSALYCHSDGSSVATGVPAVASVVWGPNKLACDGCHGNPPSYPNHTPKANNHPSHAFGCATCHAGTTGDGASISGKALHANGSYDLTPAAGTSFSYSYAKTGGSCSNVSCHQGLDATWGSNVNHLATLGADYISPFLDGTNHDDGTESVYENCALCHYANIALQHNNNCSVCHSGANPAGALVGSWNKSCSTGACHPSYHTNIDHDSFLDLGNCTQCHSTEDPWGNYGTVTGDNCGWCHSPAQTQSVFAAANPTPVDSPAKVVKGNLKLLLQMDEASWNGSTGEVLDSSGWNSNGTLTAGAASTVAGGETGRAGSFDGSSTISFKYASGVVPSNNFTLEAWVKPNAAQQIDAEATSGTYGTSGKNYLFWPTESGAVDGGAGVAVGTNGVGVYEHGDSYLPALAVYNGAISSTQWTHLAVVYRNKQPSIYLNGALVRTGLPSPRNNVYASQEIGGDVYGHYSGLADRISVYDTALSGSEILQHAQQLCTDTSNSATTVMWTTAILSSSYLDYGLTASYGTTIGNEVLTSSHALTLTGLAANATYHYRLRTTTSGGVQTVSPDATFTNGGNCLAPPVPQPPTSITPTPGDGQVTVNWTAGTGADTSMIQYGTSSGSYPNSIKPASSPTTITGLTNGAPIFFEVGAQNATGSAWSPETSATPAGPPAISAPSATAVAGTTATLGATVTATGGAALQAVGTCWASTPSPSANCAVQGSLALGSFTQPRTGLTEGSQLYYRGYATNSAGTRYTSDGIIYTEPKQPTNFRYGALGSTGATITWYTGSTGNARNVIVVMKSGSAVNADPVDNTTYTPNAVFGTGSQTGSQNYVVYTGNANAVAVTGLSPGTTYYAMIYAFAAGASGTENYNVTAPIGGSFITTGLAAPTLSTPTATLVAGTTATLGANVTGNGGATLTANGTCWGTASSPTSNCLDLGTHVTGVLTQPRTGLPEGSPVYYRGYATNSVATSYSPDGLVYTEPLQPTTLSFSAVGTAGMTLNWTPVSTGSAKNVIVVMKAGSAVSSDPVDGTSYTANATLGGGSQLGTANYVLYKGTGTSLAVTGLTPGTTYYVKLYAYAAGAAGTENYNVTSPLAGSQLIPAVVAPTVTTPTAAAVAGTTATLGANVTGNGGGTLTANGTCWGTTAAPTTNCVDQGSHATGVFTQGRTALSEGSQLYYRGYAANSAGTSYSADAIIYTEPIQPSTLSFSAVGSTGMTVNWTPVSTGTARNVIVVLRSGAAVTSDPADSTTYTANAAFGSGSQVGSLNYVVYAGTGSSVTVTGLTAGVTYYVKLYAYAAGAAGTENYNVSAPLAGSQLIPAVVAPTVTTPTAAAVAGTTATLGANVTGNGGGTLTANGTCWGTTAAPTTNCVDQGSHATGVFTQGRTALSEGSQLYYRGYAANSAGTSYSADAIIYTEPIQPSTLSFSAVGSTGMTVNWTPVSTGTAKNVIVVLKAGAAVSSDPVDGTSYTANAAFGGGSQLGTSNYAVYKGTGTSIAVTGLTAGVTYYVKVYAYAAGAAGTENYNVSSPLAGSQLTAAVVAPTVAAPTATAVASTTATLGANVTSAGGGTLSANGTCWATTAAPVANCVDQGSHATGAFTQGRTTLTEGSLLYYRGYASNSAGTSYSADATIYTQPTQPAALSFTGVGPAGITLNWATTSAGNANAVIVVLRAGSAVNADPVAGTSYSANPAFGSGGQVGTGNYVVYKGTGTSVSVTGLSPSTSYYVKVYAFAAGISGTENYNVTAPLAGIQVTPSSAVVPTVISPTATAVGSTTATLGANVTSDGGAAIYLNGTCWGLAAGPMTNCLDLGTHSTGVMAQSRTGITEGSLIYYRGYATNTVGPGWSPDGIIYTQPKQPTTLSFTGVGSAGITVNWLTGSTGNAKNVIVVMRAGSAVNSDPVAGSTYSASTVFGSGSQIGTSNYVVYKGNLTSVAVSGLNPGTSYYVTVYAFAAGGSGTENYNVTTPLTGSQATVVLVVPTVTTPTATAVTGSTATLGANVTSNGGAAITARGTVWGTSPSPTLNAAAEGGTTTGVFTQPRSALAAGTKIYYRGYATNSVGTGYSSDGSFYTEPSTPASLVNFSALTPTGMTVNWTRGSGDGVVVVMRQGAAVNFAPVDGTYSGYAGSPVFAGGTQLGSGNYVLYKGAGTSVAVTGLSGGTAYYLAVYEYKGTQDTSGAVQGTNYAAAATGNQTTTVVVAPTVTTPSATGIGVSSATLGANVTSDGGGTLTANGTCWGLTASPTTNCADQGSHATGSFTQSRTGLDAGALIYYRGYATNSAGTGYSADASMTTLPGPAPATLISATPGNGQTTISWVAGGGSTASSLRYGTASGSYGAPIAATSPLTLTGLGNGTTIYYEVGSVNAAGTTWSSEFSVLPTSSAPAQASGISATGGTGQVVINWSAASGSSVVEYGTETGVYTTVADPAASPLAISGLADQTTVFYRVGVKNLSGTTWSDEYSVRQESTQTWTAPGTYSYIVPSGVYALQLDVTGAGGGGGGGSDWDDYIGEDGSAGGSSSITYQSVLQVAAAGGSGGSAALVDNQNSGGIGGAGGVVSGALSPASALTGGTGANGWSEANSYWPQLPAGGIPNGGAGGLGSNDGSWFAPEGAGGGGGARAKAILPVTPGSTVTITIGAGGVGGQGAAIDTPGYPGANGADGQVTLTAYANAAVWATAGTYSFTVPAGVTSLNIDALGGGGNGGGSNWLMDLNDSPEERATYDSSAGGASSVSYQSALKASAGGGTGGLYTEADWSEAGGAGGTASGTLSNLVLTPGSAGGGIASGQDGSVYSDPDPLPGGAAGAPNGSRGQDGPYMDTGGGGGGGGGGRVQGKLAVTPGSVVNMTVGARGYVGISY